MVITKMVWKDVLKVLKRHGIPYTQHMERRDIPGPMEEPDTIVDDMHVQINLVIPDYFDDI